MDVYLDGYLDIYHLRLTAVIVKITIMILIAFPHIVVARLCYKESKTLIFIRLNKR